VCMCILLERERDLRARTHTHTNTRTHTHTHTHTHSYTPVNIIEAIYGLALCFFGGLYPLTIAAGETFRVSGGDRVKKCLALLWDDLKAVHQVWQYV